ncbi:Polygalacturonase [Arachis hypogaea]|nr:Polygalacturonase [Arachis hypogaea]
MDMELSTTTLVLFILLAACGITQSLVVPIAKYSGVPNSDITQALTNAWREACASPTASKIAPIELYVDGTIIVQYVDYFTLSGNGVFDGQGAIAWQQNDCGTNVNCARTPMNFGFNFMKHAVVRIITSKDSKNFNVNELGCQNFTFDGFKVIAPGNSLNTDGIHLGRSNGVRILNTDIAVGDDCISIDDGSVNTHIYNVKCGPGHGISVGSLGKYTTEAPVEGLILKKVTLTNTDNGLRIKSWPSAPGTSPISNLYYEDVTMINIRNPIIIDQEIALGTNNPSKIRIRNVSFKNIRGTSLTKEGVNLICSSVLSCEQVMLCDIDLKFNGALAVAVCRNVRPTIAGRALPFVAAN